jgi:hypothetical protein
LIIRLIKKIYENIKTIMIYLKVLKLYFNDCRRETKSAQVMEALSQLTKSHTISQSQPNSRIWFESTNLTKRDWGEPLRLWLGLERLRSSTTTKEPATLQGRGRGV